MYSRSIKLLIIIEVRNSRRIPSRISLSDGGHAKVKEVTQKTQGVVSIAYHELGMDSKYIKASVWQNMIVGLHLVTHSYSTQCPLPYFLIEVASLG